MNIRAFEMCYPKDPAADYLNLRHLSCLDHELSHLLEQASEQSISNSVQHTCERSRIKCSTVTI
jgi:hypothetical protein